jgi:hypothetical protein
LIKTRDDQNKMRCTLIKTPADLIKTRNELINSFCDQNKTFSILIKNPANGEHSSSEYRSLNPQVAWTTKLLEMTAKGFESDSSPSAHEEKSEFSE